MAMLAQGGGPGGPGGPPPPPEDTQSDPIFEIPEGLDLSGVKDGAETEVLCVIEKHGNMAVIKSVDGVPLDKELEGGGAGEGSEAQGPPQGPPQAGPPQGPGGPTGLEGDMMGRAMAAGLPPGY
jgi:hypothetical protein